MSSRCHELIQIIFGYLSVGRLCNRWPCNCRRQRASNSCKFSFLRVLITQIHVDPQRTGTRTVHAFDWLQLCVSTESSLVVRCAPHALILIFFGTFDHFANLEMAADGHVQHVIFAMLRLVCANWFFQPLPTSTRIWRSWRFLSTVFASDINQSRIGYFQLDFFHIISLATQSIYFYFAIEHRMRNSSCVSRLVVLLYRIPTDSLIR